MSEGASPTAVGRLGAGTVNRVLAGDLSLAETWFATTLVGILAVTPAISVQGAGWSEHLEPVPWIALAGVVAGFVLARV